MRAWHGEVTEVESNSLFLRCGVAGILGGIVLMCNPEINMFWRGATLTGVGCLSIVIWWTEIESRRSPGDRNLSVGPTFEVGDPDASMGAETTTYLIREVRRERDRQ